MIGKEYYIVFVRRFEELHWQILKICKTREEADEVLDSTDMVDAILDRRSEYKTRVVNV